MAVVVGQPKKRTPMMADRIRGAVLNPPWNVLAYITRKERWPKNQGIPATCGVEGYVVKANGQVATAAWPKGSLGAIKFDLDNLLGVYLHGHPAEGFLSARTCGPLSRLHTLGGAGPAIVLLLKDDPKWSADGASPGGDRDRQDDRYPAEDPACGLCGLLDGVTRPGRQRGLPRRRLRLGSDADRQAGGPVQQGRVEQVVTAPSCALTL